jgi:hypothetical protein
LILLKILIKAYNIISLGQLRRLTIFLGASGIDLKT